MIGALADIKLPCPESSGASKTRTMKKEEEDDLPDGVEERDALVRRRSKLDSATSKRLETGSRPNSPRSGRPPSRLIDLVVRAHVPGL